MATSTLPPDAFDPYPQPPPPPEADPGGDTAPSTVTDAVPRAGPATSANVNVCGPGVRSATVATARPPANANDPGRVAAASVLATPALPA